MQTSIATRSATAARAPFVHSARARRAAVRPMASAGFYGLAAKTLEGEAYPFDKFKGKVVVITNVACACGLTNSNYKELVALHDKYSSQGLEIVAFPCNQFGRQESGSPEQIRSFVKDKYGVKFTMMEKVDVNGPSTHPVWSYLKGACTDCSGDVDWNFRAKFIIDKNGNVVARTGENPSAIEGQIKELLAA
ncbi:MAG: glutathione peroxidase [Monoraphidium minutum]|nr:MAG: glutathione peroxidase [Monoraphidium minutum]